MFRTKEGTASRRRIGALAVALAACSGTLLLAAEQAAAAPLTGADAVVATAPAIGPGGYVQNTATCPQGKVVIGGGAAVVGEGSADFHTSIQETTPGTIGGGALSLWETAVRNNDWSPHTIGLYAVCANQLSGYQVVRKDVPVGAFGFMRDTVWCPSGKVALAGGASVAFEGTGDFRTSVQESAPGTIGGSTSLWLTALRNNDSVPHTIALQAVCAYPPAGYERVRKDVRVDAFGFLRDTVWCPSGKVVAGGGAGVVGEGSADFRTSIQELAPGTVGGGAVSLSMTALRNNDSVPHTIGLESVCVNPPSGYQVVRRDF